MLFKDFLGSIEKQSTLDQIHLVMKKHLCFNYNVQCMNDDDEYHATLDKRHQQMYVTEEEPGIYSVWHKHRKVMMINFNDGVVWEIT